MACDMIRIKFSLYKIKYFHENLYISFQTLNAHIRKSIIKIHHKNIKKLLSNNHCQSKRTAVPVLEPEHLQEVEMWHIEGATRAHESPKRLMSRKIM